MHGQAMALSKKVRFELWGVPLLCLVMGVWRLDSEFRRALRRVRAATIGRKQTVRLDHR